MGTYQPKPFKRLCKITKKWITVTPDPVEYNQANKYNQRDEILKAELLEQVKLTNENPV